MLLDSCDECGEIVTKDNEGGICARCHRTLCEDCWALGTSDLCPNCK